LCKTSKSIKKKVESRNEEVKRLKENVAVKEKSFLVAS